MVGRRTFVQQSDLFSTPLFLMGDKSPKSQQKNKKQKQTKNDASDSKKAKAIASKQQANLPPAKKK